MRAIVVVACCLTSPAVAVGRPVRVWSYEDLIKESDVVAIVKVTKVADADVTIAGYGEPKQYQGRRASVVVGLMLKGKFQPSLTFDFFTYAARVGSPPNGAMFADLSKADCSGQGHYDAQMSICEIAPQGLIEMTGLTGLARSCTARQGNLPWPALQLASAGSTVAWASNPKSQRQQPAARSPGGCSCCRLRPCSWS